MSSNDENAVLTKLSIDDGKILAHFETTQQISIDELKQVLPQYVVAKNGDVYLADEKNRPILHVDINSDIGKVLFSDIEHSKINNTRSLMTIIDTIIPSKFHNKYCLIFNKQLWFVSDTLADLEQKKLEFPTMNFTVYYPPHKE